MLMLIPGNLNHFVLAFKFKLTMNLHETAVLARALSCIPYGQRDITKQLASLPVCLSSWHNLIVGWGRCLATHDPVVLEIQHWACCYNAGQDGADRNI